MDLQIVLPDESPAVDAQRVIDLGVEAERLGYETAWLPDHLLPPRDYGETYGGVYEPLVTLTYLAARTSRIRLGTSVLVLPMRSPFVVAKQAATLHELSGARFVLGVGIGWDRTEFESVDADFTTRGARTDEAIALLRHLWTSREPFQGTHYGYDQGVFEPQPRGRLPIMVGGTSDRAVARAAALADEWQGVGVEPATFAEVAARLRNRAQRPLRLGTRIAWSGGADELTQVIDQAHRFADAGADALAVWFGPAEGTEERMAEFAARMRG